MHDILKTLKIAETGRFLFLDTLVFLPGIWV